MSVSIATYRAILILLIFHIMVLEEFENTINFSVPHQPSHTILALNGNHDFHAVRDNLNDVEALHLTIQFFGFYAENLAHTVTWTNNVIA
jgi:hypothetical protein